ncbi:MAG: hypothetical protein RMJ51_01760 [Candidatus Calescibacterium sp.]|nr:hypothetical protein [Candidatus Calescibacterium sp.]MCX7971839.1 hypothetical protein [bacterium]MDW8194954.1 hypothetical protein [Candidatus Calescibacterium sp.]
MKNLETIVPLIEERRQELFMQGITDSLIFSCISFLVIFIVLLIVLKNFYEKKFSFYIKKKIFNSIKNLPQLEGIEIIEYKDKGRNFENVLREYYDFNVYNEEDIFLFKLKNIQILMSEVQLQKQEGSGKNRRYITIFRGVVYRIPEKTFAFYPDLRVGNIISHMGYIYILRPKNKDLFELSLLKKVNTENLHNFLNELKENIEFIKKFYQ